MIAIGASLAKTNFKSLAEGKFSHPKNERIRIDPIRQMAVSSIRTFSKAFALPSLRLGYVIGHPDFIQHLYKIRGPYDVNMLALVAARAQLEEPKAWQSYVRQVMEGSKPMLEQFFLENQVKFYKGEAHFMLVVPDKVNEAIQFLKEHQILVRPMRSPIEHTFRMNAGTQEQTQRFINVYQQYLSVK